MTNPTDARAQTSEPKAGTVVLVHPDDVNLADAKALAAQHNATVEGNRYVPRGQMFVCRAEAVR